MCARLALSARTLYSFPLCLCYQLFGEALRRYAQTEEWQITEVRRTLAGLENGVIGTVDGEEMVARFLATGRLTREALTAAEERYGIPILFGRVAAVVEQYQIRLIAT